MSIWTFDASRASLESIQLAGLVLSSRVFRRASNVVPASTDTDLDSDEHDGQDEVSKGVVPVLLQRVSDVKR